MLKDKRKRFVILVVVITALIVTILLPAISKLFDNKAEEQIQSANNRAPINLDKENENETDDVNSKDTLAKYYTVSTGGNVDIGVIFKNPLNKNDKELIFEVMLNTHSVDLSDYKELDKFVEIEVDNEIIIKDGFTWESQGDGHHINGVIKIKNEYNNKPILSNNTKVLKIIFKDIAGMKEREHIYQGETLRI